MKRIHASAMAVLAAVTLGATTPVQANSIFEVVNARANARAGGPTNAHDAWLLERYGALSGTPGYEYQYKKKKKYRRNRRRNYSR